jgi:predicted acetyltransferase
MTFRWVGDDELDRVAETRLQCYNSIGKELEIYQRRIREDGRARAGDFLLAERDGAAVGTTTSYSMTMWVRGAALACQGVAWVGTIKTHRRRNSSPEEKGIASRLMQETLSKARERGQIMSALMPFRASFYEHFGYGLVERQNEWTLPLTILPGGDCSGMEFVKAMDLQAIKQCRQRMVRSGQCDIERSDESWQMWSQNWPEGFCVVDRENESTVHSWMFVMEQPQEGQTRLLRVMDAVWDSPAAFLKMLCFLGSLRDQYCTAKWVLPADLPVNRMLKEPQIPHRPVSHLTASLAQNTRMQVRILDHIRFLEALNLPSDVSGRINVTILEPEGAKTALAIEVSGGHASATPTSAEPAMVCSASTWASIACGDLPVSEGMLVPSLTVNDPAAARLLRVFPQGPVPFCGEYF